MQQQKKEQVKNIEDVRTQKVKWIHHRRAIPRRGWQVKNKKKPSALSMWGFFLHLVNYIFKTTQKFYFKQFFVCPML